MKMKSKHWDSWSLCWQRPKLNTRRFAMPRRACFHDTQDQQTFLHSNLFIGKHLAQQQLICTFKPLGSMLHFLFLFLSLRLCYIYSNSTQDRTFSFYTDNWSTYTDLYLFIYFWRARGAGRKGMSEVRKEYVSAPEQQSLGEKGI